jgi:hypothetical protein
MALPKRLAMLLDYVRKLKGGAFRCSRRHGASRMQGALSAGMQPIGARCSVGRVG